MKLDLGANPKVSRFIRETSAWPDGPFMRYDPTGDVEIELLTTRGLRVTIGGHITALKAALEDEAAASPVVGLIDKL